jgi:small subunit ribosomal protein S9
MKKTEKNKYINTLGRRKRSVARIRLYTGKGSTTVNSKPIDEYFKDIPAERYLKPFTITQTTGKYYATARIVGGGKNGQLGAFLHGLSRAFSILDPEKYHKILKVDGLLTRDPRERERRKFGLAQGARAAKQSPKR